MYLNSQAYIDLKLIGIGISEALVILNTVGN